jgi:hypothetical protein
MTTHINDTVTEEQIISTNSPIKKIIDTSLGIVATVAAPVLIAQGINYSHNKGQAICGIGLIITGYAAYKVGQINFIPPSQRPKHLGGTLDITEYYKFLENAREENLKNIKIYKIAMNEKYNEELKEYFSLGVKGIN